MEFKSGKKQTIERAPIWQTIYADMMTNLMLFFLTLFLLTRLDAQTTGKIKSQFKEQFGSRKVASTAEVERHRASEDDFLDEAKKIQGFTEMSEKRFKFMLPGEVMFDSASSELKPGAKEILQSTLSVLTKTADKIMIEGHTDDIPINSAAYTSNWELSLARAEAVMDYFLESGLPAGQLCIAGYGEYKPLLPNTSAENRSKNRRIEIMIVKEE